MCTTVQTALGLARKLWARFGVSMKLVEVVPYTFASAAYRSEDASVLS
jgi:hypothetical protein